MTEKRGRPRASLAWLPLGEASRMVGVDPDTLRRWSDEGRVEVYHTPGGHRRFERRSLERLVRSSPTEPARISRLGAPEKRLVAAYRRTYRAGHADALPDFRSVPESDRAAFRTSGRQLVRDLVSHLDGDGPAQATALRSATELAAELGARLAHSQASLTEAVSLFVIARQPFMSELGVLAKRRALDSRQVAELLNLASSALDRCLLSFIEGHQRHA